MTPRKATAPTDDLDQALAEGEDKSAQEAADTLGLDTDDEKKKAPAKKAPAKKKGPGRARGSKSRADLTPALRELLGTVGVAVSMFQPADGAAVLRHSDSIATALGKLAHEDARVYRALEAALTGTAWGGVAFAVAPLALEIAGNHGWLGTGPLGMPATAPEPTREEGDGADGDPTGASVTLAG